MSLYATDCRHLISRLYPLRRGGFGLWQNTGRCFQLPSHLRSWLTDPSSLTARLNQLGGKPISVHIVQQGWGRPSLSEANTLGIAPHSACLVREVILRGPQQQPWVFARSLFPATSLKGPLKHLRHLGRRPLGGYLFSHAQLGRSALQLALLPPTGLVPEALQGSSALWGRRSVFTLHNKKLLVSEIFLPAFEHTLTRTD
ncbi:chorismate lyase [Gilvimarinus agarilyticus]|uniref:chorismate--pyruvate lyase family protein n=1 Tax=unclassified Gilvimarinus TaxID=2642066 RepID=UPI001C087C4E|nr:MULTISPECIES: chorismate lyase [unclassified Gilvimarinus]MBU2884527.1 chorismate lyase [Gilvimarinus agarilyticus]MDO6569655.1 chorismate lyase [Gilvimarinus sp. 2_MG-2023]MDO6748018.1 chorismate lyase [Gilvimarinus sp. 1_MG-2023]